MINQRVRITDIAIRPAGRTVIVLTPVNLTPKNHPVRGAREPHPVTGETSQRTLASSDPEKAIGRKLRGRDSNSQPSG
jgi:hypothetical protein